MKFTGTRMQMDPIEVWGFNNGWKLLQYRLIQIEPDRSKWYTHVPEFSNDYISGVVFGILVSLLVVLSFYHQVLYHYKCS